MGFVARLEHPEIDFLNGEEHLRTDFTDQRPLPWNVLEFLDEFVGFDFVGNFFVTLPFQSYFHRLSVLHKIKNIDLQLEVVLLLLEGFEQAVEIMFL